MVQVVVIAIVLFIPIIWLLVKNQGLSTEVRRFRAVAKHEGIQFSKSITILRDFSDVIQKELLSQLESSIKSGLVDQRIQDVLRPLFGATRNIILRCCEYGEIPEEALRNALATSNLEVSTVSEYIDSLPDDIKLAWKKNNLEGFISACVKINANLAGKQKVVQEEDENVKESDT